MPSDGPSGVTQALALASEILRTNRTATEDEITEKRVQKVRDQAATLVGSGETVRHAVPVTSGPLFALALGPLGVAFLKFRVVVLTDRALYLMSMKATGGPKEVEQELPLGSTPVSTDKASLPVWSTIVVGDQRYNVAKPFKSEAEALVAAVSAGASTASST